MRVAVTGATGFIGRHLVDRLLSEGHDVTALARNPAAIPLLKARGITAIRGDVLDRQSLERLMTGSGAVINLARAKAHGSRPSEAFAVNVTGARNVARAAIGAGAQRIVHCSSASVYGSRCGLVSETDRLSPDSAYARSKARGEAALLKECGSRIETVVARITAVLGPRCMSWLPLFRSAASGTLRLVGDGTNMHHPADVSDIVDGLVRCAFVTGAEGFYNLAGPEPLTISALRDAMAKAASRDPEVADRIRHPKSYLRPMIDAYYHFGVIADKVAGLRPPLTESVAFLSANRILDLTRARTGLGYVPCVGVGEAAQRTADWYRREGLL